MPVSTITIRPNAGCARHMYNSTVLIRHAKRVPDEELLRGYSLATLCRQHHIYYGMLGGGSMKPIHSS